MSKFKSSLTAVAFVFAIAAAFASNESLFQIKGWAVFSGSTATEHNIDGGFNCSATVNNTICTVTSGGNTLDAYDTKAHAEAAPSTVGLLYRP